MYNNAEIGNRKHQDIYVSIAYLILSVSVGMWSLNLSMEAILDKCYIELCYSITPKYL